MRKATLATVFLGISAGLAVGISGFTFVYAEGYSYLTDDPTACANCHVMRSQHDGWMKSSHRVAATCNDCHTPSGFLAKYATKVSNGFWHSFAFTSGRFPDPIKIKSHNRDIAEASCAKCHLDMVESVGAARPDSEPVSCVRCHGSVGHLR